MRAHDPADTVLRDGPDGFLALYDATVAEVYSYLRSRVVDRALAEDLTQEVFLAAARRARSGLTVELPWLVTVARNKMVDHWRAAARRERTLAIVRQRRDDPEHVTAEPLEPGRATEALGTLNPTYRAALVLRHVDQLSVPEVAEHLGRSVAATEQVLSRARVAFRTAYEGTSDA